MSGLLRTTLRALCLAAAIAAFLRADAPVAAQERLEDRWPRVDIEATYYRQPELLDRALARMLPSEAGRPRLFFVGFAGYGAQAVFKREVLAVRDLFDKRFGTRERSLVLINHASTLADTPLANVTNLDRALQRIGGLMDKSEDVLFLFLTSHGLERVFAVEMPGFGFNDLTPERLREVLDRSGIENRVVVVSACHSGSFVRDLAGPRTLVITAADADRKSFGCSDKRSWTYFGDAYFNRALRKERSFERAFEHANRLITRWEAREKLERSKPQISGGGDLRSRLDTLVGASEQHRE